jgi:penicillin-binding protein 2
MRLVWEGDRWGVVWDEGLILPELAGGNRLAMEPRVPARGNKDIQAVYAGKPPDWYLPVGQISEETLQTHIATLEPFIGAGLDQPKRQPARLYAEHGVAEEVEEYRALGYSGDEIVGLAGLEAWGEPYLSGERGGVLTVVGPSGEFVALVQEKEAKAARSVYTTFDLEFQAAVEQALADLVNSHPLAERGAVVVLDVANGAVRAMRESQRPGGRLGHGA